MKNLLFCLFVFLSATAGAAVIHVSITGNDTTGNGSVGTPYASITKAFTVVAAGDTITNDTPGYYDERPYLSTSGTAGNLISITLNNCTNRGFKLGSFGNTTVANYVLLSGARVHNPTDVTVPVFDVQSGVKYSNAVAPVLTLNN